GNPCLLIVYFCIRKRLLCYALPIVGGIVVKGNLSKINRLLGKECLNFRLKGLHVNPIVIVRDNWNATLTRSQCHWECCAFHHLGADGSHFVGLIAFLDYDGIDKRLVSRSFGHHSCYRRLAE